MTLELRRRPFLIRFWRHYREYRRIGFSVVTAAREAWALAHV